LPGGLLAPALGFAALLLLLEVGCGFVCLSFAELGSGSLRRLRPARLPASPFLTGSEVGWEILVFSEASVRSRRSLENHAGLRHRRGGHVTCRSTPPTNQ
jgi:hypothetical protein